MNNPYDYPGPGAPGDHDDANARTLDDISGLTPRRQLELSMLSEQELIRQYRDTALDLELACLCWSVSKNNAAVEPLRLAFMAPNVAGLLNEQLALDRLGVLQGIPLTGPFVSLSGQYLN